MTSIEKSLKNIASFREGLDDKLERLAHVEVPPSAFVNNIGDGSLADLIAGATADTMARTAARLRVLHETSGTSVSAPLNSFGKPATGRVIDAEFTEVESEE